MKRSREVTEGAARGRCGGEESEKGWGEKTPKGGRWFFLKPGTFNLKPKRTAAPPPRSARTATKRPDGTLCGKRGWNSKGREARPMVSPGPCPLLLGTEAGQKIFWAGFLVRVSFTSLA